MASYASLCGECKDLLSRHLLVEGGTVPAGPWRCVDCGCEIGADHGLIPLTTQADYNAWKRAHPGRNWDEDPAPTVSLAPKGGGAG